MSNIGTLLFHLRRIQQSSCQRQRAGLADCELPQGPAASAHFMFCPRALRTSSLIIRNEFAR